MDTHLPSAHELRRAVKRRQPEMLQDLKELVCAESPSQNKAAVDQASRLAARWAQGLGARIHWHRQRHFGDLLEARWNPQHRYSAAPPILLLGHIDTVWPIGTLTTMPFRMARGRAFGPGAFDMKAGIVMALHALALLREQKALQRPVTLLLNSEEEIGSPCSQRFTEKLAREHSAVFVLEPAQGSAGAYKTARKGVGRYTLRVRGVAAHSGVDFAQGHSAILELAHLLEQISGFSDARSGITINPGLIRGGSAVNVVAAEAEAELDVRIGHAKDAARIERKLRALRTTDRACSVEITGGIERPPMERTAATVRLFRQAQQFARSLGFDLEEASTGGGSDGNFTAALGIPTLDGMGAVGEGAHAKHESILVRALAPRTALLAAMIAGGVFD